MTSPLAPDHPNHEKIEREKLPISWESAPKQYKQPKEPDCPPEDPPIPVPQAVVSIFEVNAVCISKGNNAVIFTTTPGMAIDSPNAECVITALSQAIYDQFTVGKPYKVEVKST